MALAQGTGLGQNTAAGGDGSQIDVLALLKILEGIQGSEGKQAARMQFLDRFQGPQNVLGAQGGQAIGKILASILGIETPEDKAKKAQVSITAGLSEASALFAKGDFKTEADALLDVAKRRADSNDPLQVQSVSALTQRSRELEAERLALTQQSSDVAKTDQDTLEVVEKVSGLKFKNRPDERRIATARAQAAVQLSKSLAELNVTINDQRASGKDKLAIENESERNALLVLNAKVTDSLNPHTGKKVTDAEFGVATQVAKSSRPEDPLAQFMRALSGALFDDEESKKAAEDAATSSNSEPVDTG